MLPAFGLQAVFTHWEFAPVVTVAVALTGAAYLWGVWRVARRHPARPWPWWRTALFFAGLAVVVLATQSGIGAYDDVLAWDHMVQHLLLIMVAAPLFAIASPIELAWKSTTGTAHIAVTEVLRSGVAKFFGHWAVAFVLYAVLIPISHLTTWYNLTLENDGLHNAEHFAFLLVGYMFWRQIFGNDPNCYRMHPAMQFFYLFMAIPIDTFTGLSLAGATKEMFPAYVATHRTWGPSYVNDLHIGGSIMWVVGDTLMLWPMIPVALRWMHQEERKAERIDRELDAQALAEQGDASQPRSINSTRTPSGSVQ